MATNNTKKKILIFSTAYYPFVGGAEVAIKEITDRLPEFDFDLITARLQKDLSPIEKIGRVNVYRVGVGHQMFDKLAIPFYGAFIAWKLNKNFNYICLWGVMVTFGSGAGYIYNIFRRLIGKKKIPMILTLQEGDSENHLQYKWLGLIALSWKLALRQTAILTAISNFLLNRAKKNGYKGDSFLVPNGVDTKSFTKEVSLKTRNELKARLGKKIEDIFLVTSGRLTYKNAVDDIVSSLVYLSKNISLIVIGKGEEGRHLQKQVQNLNLIDRVKFLGFISHEDLPKYLSICDVFIRPSRSEGFGNSFIEAMSVGLPVIATPVGGIPDFIDDKETGVFCSPDNPQSIAQAVKILLGDDALRAKIIEKARSRVVECYSWERVALEMREVFNLSLK